MILVTDNLLNQDEIDYLRGLYVELESEAGANTAEGDLKTVKNNHQLKLGERAGEIRTRVLEALNRSSALSYAIIPKTVSMPLLNRYQPGMAYGRHTDAHLGMTNKGYFRCDVSCTIFLDEPASYTGGELEITTDQGLRSYKVESWMGRLLSHPICARGQRGHLGRTSLGCPMVREFCTRTAKTLDALRAATAACVGRGTRAGDLRTPTEVS